jgi:cytochrome d ubiquinol oxidase subunit II
MRTDGVLAERARQWVAYMGVVTIVAFALAGVWLAFGIDGYSIVSQPPLDAQPNPLAKSVEVGASAWLANYSAYPTTLLFPALGFVGVGVTILLARAKRPGLGFITSSLGITGIIMTAGVSMFPFIMPSSTVPSSSLTVWDAPSSHLTLTVMFWAVLIFLPIVISYTAWNYYKMWGKVTTQDLQDRFSAY